MHYNIIIRRVCINKIMILKNLQLEYKKISIDEI